MAKSINVSGRMSVERFNGEFQKAFGVRCNVKISKWVNADGKATLASIRPKDFKGPSKVDLSIVGNMTVGTLKKRFEENFGVMIELYIGRKIAPDDVTITEGFVWGTIASDAGQAFAEKMRLTRTGKVGIGTTVPTASLDVVGEIVMRRNAIRNPRFQAWVMGG